MAGIVLTIEELRPNISSKFSDSWKNPIKRTLRKRIDASVQPFREVCHVRQSTVDDQPLVLLTIEASRQHHGFELEFAAGGEAGLATHQSRKPMTDNSRSR
jgi:hypothetical protein